MIHQFMDYPMEESNIRYTGITQATSDLGCADGDLSFSHNLIIQNGGMRPIVLPDAEFTLGEGERLVYIHVMSQYKNYLVTTTDGKLGFYDQDFQYELIEGFSGADSILSVSSVGNTVIVFSDEGMHYLLYRDGLYEYLGQKPPETVISFSLTGKSQVLVKSTGSNSGQSLWMIQKNSGDESWSEPVRVSREAEDVHTGDWKTYVFRKAHLDISGIVLPNKPTGNDPVPDGWSDFPDEKGGGWCICIGSVNNADGTIAWSDVYMADDKYGQGSVKFRFFANSSADEAPPCDRSATNPEGWLSYPPSVNTDEDSVFSVSLSDGFEESEYKLLEADMLDRIELSDDDKTTVSTDVLGKAALWVYEATKENKFVYPFFVRYAYRLYDGSYIMQSAPLLMVPNSSGRPAVIINRMTGKDGNVNTLYYQVVGPHVELEIHKLVLGEGLEKWKDIVTGIDIFVSEQFYNYLPNGQLEYLYSREKYAYKDAYTLSRLDNYSNFGSYMYTYQKLPVLSPEALYGTSVMEIDDEGRYLYGSIVIDLPEVEDAQGDYLEKIRSNGLFYLFKSYSIDPDDEDYLKEGTVEADENQLRNLNLQKTLPDDYQTHDLIKPLYAFAYNQRLNLANVRRELFDGFPAEMQVGYNVSFLGSEIMELKNYYTIFIYVHAVDGEEIIVSQPAGEEVYYFTDYLFYPDPNAYKAVIVYGSQIRQAAEIQLTEHKSLNGAYWFSGFKAGPVYESISPADVPVASANREIVEKNKIYTSEAGNPFYFPLGGINTVGVGEIRGISSTTRALSQGQFGQFPLLVFATDGIWAMEVSDTGLYSVKQPMSRDVCTNPQSITQTDGAVVFVSDKGLMVVDGSNVDLLSAELDGPSFDPQTVDRLHDVLAKENLLEEVGNQVPVKDFLEGCRIAYDYPNARLVLFREGSPYAYVYSLNSRTWATMSANFVTEVTDYPNSYLQRITGEVVNLSQKQDYDDTGKEVRIFLLSRPMKLGDDALKTVNAVVNRGQMRRMEGAVMVFASHDGMNYVPIGSARGYRVTRLQGSPYRYFRVAIVRDMHIGESLAQTSVYFTRKWRNKPR